MEVLDLDICHFVQFRPEEGIFQPMELDVTIVHRDRQWFETYLPQFQGFIHDLEYIKANPTKYIPVNDRKRKEEKIPRQSKKKRLLNDFLIKDDDIRNDNFQDKCLIIGE